MNDLAGYVTEHKLFGRRGFIGLNWHCRELLAGVDPRGGHALEIGAGDGMISLWLLHAGARSVVSLEPEGDGSTNGVGARAAAHRRALGLDGDWTWRAETLQAYAPDRAFRVIVSQNSVNHLDEDACVHLLDDASARARYRSIFGRLRDILEPGGSLVVADCARANHWARLFGSSPWAPQIEWHKHQEPETWAAIMDEAGLAPVSVRWWHPYYRVRALAPVIGNRAAARWLSSFFVVRALRR
jgi:hypothetical protein